MLLSLLIYDLWDNLKSVLNQTGSSEQTSLCKIWFTKTSKGKRGKQFLWREKYAESLYLFYLSNQFFDLVSYWRDKLNDSVFIELD